MAYDPVGKTNRFVEFTARAQRRYYTLHMVRRKRLNSVASLPLKASRAAPRSGPRHFGKYPCASVLCASRCRTQTPIEYDAGQGQVPGPFFVFGSATVTLPTAAKQ